ncbi:hypothetical protein PSAC2689_120139 [Paraburkholderia sacchari]
MFTRTPERRDAAWHKFGAVQHACCALSMRHGDAFAQLVNRCAPAWGRKGQAPIDSLRAGLELA